MVTNEIVDVRAVILAGVHRWGGSTFEQMLPRPLMPVALSPLICYPLRWLRDNGVSNTAICANSDSHLMRQFLGDGHSLGLDLHYYEDLTPRGPAGCVRDAWKAWPARDVIVIEGSVVPDLDFADLIDVHRSTQAALTVVSGTNFAGGSVNPGWPSPVGIYVFSRDALQAIPSTGYQDIKEILIPRLHANGMPLTTYALPGGVLRVTGFESYMHTNGRLLESMSDRPATLAGFSRTGSALVHDTARVAADARLIGNVLVGPDATIDAGATVVGPTVIGAASEIGAEAIVSRSVLWDHCGVESGALVDRCLLGADARATAPNVYRNSLCLGDAARAGERFWSGTRRFRRLLPRTWRPTQGRALRVGSCASGRAGGQGDWADATS